MGIVHKDPNDPGPVNLKEKLLRLICEIKHFVVIWEGHDIENFRCKKCGAKFIQPFSQSDRLQVPPRPPTEKKP